MILQERYGRSQNSQDVFLHRSCKCIAKLLLVIRLIVGWVEAMRYPTFCMVCCVSFLKRQLLPCGNAKSEQVGTAQRTGSLTYTRVIL